MDILIETWKTLVAMAPYLLLGFGVAGILSVLISPEKVEKHLGGNGLMPVLKASIFGVPLPLCSCGVIPVAASLRRHGSSRGATMSFLLSTPQTGVDSIFVTYGMLGPIFAIFRPVVAFVTGIVGGVLMNEVETDAERQQDRKSSVADYAGNSQSVRSSRVLRALHFGFVSVPRDIAKPMLVGLLVAGVLGSLVPHDFFAGQLGSGLPAMLVMMLIGIPLYVCATASVPIAAALITVGVSPGAALVFLITGPASNTATIATVWKVLGRKATAVYLGTIAGTALAAGYTLDLLFKVSGVKPTDLTHCAETSVVGIISAVILLAIIAYSLIKPSVGHKHSGQGGGETLEITGMTCSHLEGVGGAGGSGGGKLACGCPGSMSTTFKPGHDETAQDGGVRESQLTHWPLQLHLISPLASQYKGSDVLLAADCVAYSVGDFHKDYLTGKSLCIACPKLDEGQDEYSEKITALIDEAKINTLTVMIMEVPCCGGLLALAQEAASKAKRKVPIKALVVSRQGKIIEEKWV